MNMTASLLLRSLLQEADGSKVDGVGTSSLRRSGKLKPFTWVK